MSTPTPRVRRPVLLVILDGFGFNPRTERRILDRVIERLTPLQAATIGALAEAVWRDAAGGTPALDRGALLRLVLSPVLPTAAVDDALAGAPYAALDGTYHRTRDELSRADGGGTALLAHCNALLEEEALAARYTIWYARSPFLNGLRNEYPTVPTEAAGLAAGYEDVLPAVQGNSETGHQQIGNFIVAAQTPLEISTEIADGSFFENPLLVEALNTVKQRQSALDISFLLSGEYGNDGRVHSAWNHLKAVLEAAFVRTGLSPQQVRIEAITDGRDCPPRSSIETSGGQYGFLYKLQSLLQRYNAETSLAWILGRSIAMDRDYEQKRTEQDFRMLVNGEGTVVPSFDAAIDAVRQFHAGGGTDTNVPALLVGEPARTIQAGDVFLNLNFRADRQRAKVASLLGARDYIESEAGKKGQHWSFDWMRPPADLQVYCLAEYDPAFADQYGAKVLYPTRPQAHNLFAILPEQSRIQRFPFRYLLTAESTKALHVGYFIRGRREQPVVPDEEERTIIPSYGAAYGVATDDDYYKTPQMRAFSLAETVVAALARRELDLIAVNFSNTDMIGHLMPRRWSEAQRSVELVDTALGTIVPAAMRAGYDVIITADHGNIEDDDASHTANNVLTTFISPDHELALRHDPREPARLFDIPWCVVEIMGLQDEVLPHLPPIPGTIAEQGLVGRSLIRVREPDSTPAG